MKKIRKNFIVSAILLMVFCLFTAGVRLADVKPVGPDGSCIGFSAVNRLVFDLLGENAFWYNLTELLGAVAICVVAGFGIFGLIQAIKRKSVFKVDGDILLLGAYYVVIAVLYVFFEKFIVNYRPVIIDGVLEASYPSSHTMLVVCVMAAASMQFGKRVKNKSLRTICRTASVLVAVVTVIGRLASGVHWFTDITGSVILSSGLIMLYRSGCLWLERKNEERGEKRK